MILLWFPAVVLGVHVALVPHVLSVLGHWPQQYRDPEVRQLGITLRVHEILANLGMYGLPIAGVALAVIGFAHRAQETSRVTSREIATFLAPLLVWILAVVATTELSEFYGWLWD
jgi:hypothetical protein